MTVSLAMGRPNTFGWQRVLTYVGHGHPFELWEHPGTGVLHRFPPGGMLVRRRGSRDEPSIVPPLTGSR